jgi:hypothetical protein
MDGAEADDVEAPDEEDLEVVEAEAEAEVSDEEADKVNEGEANEDEMDEEADEDNEDETNEDDDEVKGEGDPEVLENGTEPGERMAWRPGGGWWHRAQGENGMEARRRMVAQSPERGEARRR